MSLIILLSLEFLPNLRSFKACQMSKLFREDSKSAYSLPMFSHLHLSKSSSLLVIAIFIMGIWERLAPQKCELHLLGHPCWAGWVENNCFFNLQDWGMYQQSYISISRMKINSLDPSHPSHAALGFSNTLLHQSCKTINFEWGTRCGFDLCCRNQGRPRGWCTSGLCGQLQKPAATCRWLNYELRHEQNLLHKWLRWPSQNVLKSLHHEWYWVGCHSTRAPVGAFSVAHVCLQ